MPEARVELRDLEVYAGERRLVHGVDLDLAAGRLTALVGASGSGKTLTARSLLGLITCRPGITAGSLRVTMATGAEHRPLELRGRARERAFARIRGGIVGYLAQDARGSLDPLWSVGHQVRFAARLGGGDDPLPWLLRAGLRDPERVADLYPHELSGGMAQRVAIAQVLARGSRFILADEPTTGLDATVQAAILKELRSLRDDLDVGILLITHDLRILPSLADEVLVMDGGTLVERSVSGQLTELASPPARALVEATRRVAAGRLG